VCDEQNEILQAMSTSQAPIKGSCFKVLQRVLLCPRCLFFIGFAILQELTLAANFSELIVSLKLCWSGETLTNIRRVKA
jgi:hypothetical protein